MALKRIKDWLTSITSFRTGDVIPVDGPSGTAKMSKDTLLTLTSQNALAGNTLEVKDFDPTRTSENPYLPGESCVYGGRVYIFRVPHYGAWNISDVNQRRSIASFDASIKILNRRKIPTNSYSMVYSDEFDLLYRIPVVSGDIITFNTGEDGCSVVVYEADSTAFQSATLTGGNSEGYLPVSYVAGRTPSYVNIPISIKNRTLCYVTKNGTKIFDGKSNGNNFENEKQTNCETLNLYFIGDDNTYSYNEFYNKFVGGHKYRINILNTTYAETGTNPSVFKLLCRPINSDGTQDSTNLVAVYQGSPVSSSYEFTMPTGKIGVRFGGRAVKGLSIVAICEDITYAENVRNEFNDKFFVKKERLVISTESLENQDIEIGIPQHNGKTTRVLTNDLLVFPTTKFTITFKAPDVVWFYLATYTASGTFAGYLYQIDGVVNGETASVDVSSNANYGYRIMFGRKGNLALSASDVKQMIADGELEMVLDYDCVDYENDLQVNRALACKKKVITSQPWFADLPTFVHVSDLHGDAKRLDNALKIANIVKADAVMNSGDSVMYDHSNGTGYLKSVFSSTSIPLLFCIGNHESYPTGQTGLFTDNIQPLVTPNGYLKASGTPADNCYWYKDFDTKKIRVIAINYYNGGVYAGSLGQAQLDWFVASLLDTPTGYGVIIEIHSPEDRIIAITGSDKFYQRQRGLSYQEDGFYVGDRPIMHIVDAFISKTSGNVSYTDNGESVSVNFDFSGVDVTTEFIAYVVGHRHEDWIGKYYRSTNLQISLGITAGTAISSIANYYGFANQEDLPRNDGRGICQDAINVYSIDRGLGIINVARIGADVATDMLPRDYMTIAYR